MRLYTQCLTLLLRPVVKFCLRRSIKIQDVIESTKIVFVDLAEQELRREKHDVSVSKISLMTGLHRRDVSRLYRSSFVKQQSTSLVARIIGQWQKDRRFSSKSGSPRVLSFDGLESDFADLIQSVSRELNPYTILFEMERIGAVTRTPRGLKLVARAFVPRGDLKQSIDLMAKDCEDLMSAVEENLEALDTERNLHLKTEYDNIPSSHLPKIRGWVMKEGSAFQERVRNFISRYDRDIHPELDGNGPRSRVAVGAFSRMEIVGE